MKKLILPLVRYFNTAPRPRPFSSRRRFGWARATAAPVRDIIHVNQLCIVKNKLLAASLLCLTLGSASAHASTLYWSGNGTTLGGGGTWDTTSARWGTSISGPFTTVWNNVGSDTATLSAGTAATSGGSVVLGANITMNGTLTWEQPGLNPSYSIDGAATLTFNAGSLLNCNNAGGPGLSVGTFNAAYAGTITKSGTAQVEFNNSSGNVTKFIFKKGIASFAAPSLFGSGADVSDFLTFDGGILRINTTTAWTQGKSITVNSGGGTITSSSATITLTQDKPITWSGGNLTVNISPLILSSTASSGSGTLSLTTATTCNAANVIPSAVLVTMASGATLTLNGFDQTIKSISGTAGTVAVGASTLTLADPQSDTYSSVFTGSGKVVKNGSSLLALSGSSTGFTGEFDLNAGTVGVGNVNCFGGSSGTGLLVINNSPTIAAFNSSSRAMTIRVTLNGNVIFDDTYTTTPGQITWNTGAWTLGAGTHTITVNRTAGSYTIIIGAVVTESGGTAILTKAGNGILQLNNSCNNYSGGSMVNAGTLDAAAGSLGGGNVTVASGATLQLDSTTAMNSTANLTLASAPTAGSGNLNFTGTQTIRALYFGTTSKAQGTWGRTSSAAQHKNAAFTGTGLLNVTSGGTATTTVLSPISPSPVCYGTAVNLTATVTGGSNGDSVQFFDNGSSLGTASLSSGSATLAVSSLAVGVHNNITATYLGNENANQSSSSAGSVTVSPASVGGTTTAVASPVCSGSAPTITLSGITGNVVKWQYSLANDFASDVHDIANTTTTLNNAPAITATTYYRAVVASGACSSANSSVATVTINAAPLAPSPNVSSNVAPKLSLKIKISELLAAWTGSSLSVQSVGNSTAGGTVSKDSTYIYYLPPSGTVTSDHIPYNVSGANGCTTAAQIDVSFMPQGGAAQCITSTGGAVTIIFAGIPTYQYDVQRSPDSSFSSCATVLTTNAPAAGIFTFTETPPATSAYYRLMQH